MAPPVEISIPSTKLSATDKPYTLYTISLRLPLRTFTVDKRYSDFLALNSALASQTGSAPPATLPAKSWFSRTVNNPDLTESRRKGLEAYLQTINKTEDPKWRHCSAWRTFLNLPSSWSGADGKSKESLHSSLTTPGQGANGAIQDPGVWLDVHRELKSQLHEAREYLTKRDQATTAQGQHENSANAKRCLVKAGTLITSLEDGLKRLSQGSEEEFAWGREKIGDGEVRRRRDLIAAARKERDGLETILNSLASRSTGGMVQGGTGGAAATASDKEGLWRGTSAAGNKRAIGESNRRVLGAPLKETERTRELDNEGVLQLQRQIIAEQDEDVLDLTKVVRRLKEMGVQINDELQYQNKLLEMLDEDVDRVGGKIDIAKKRVAKIR